MSLFGKKEVKEAEKLVSKLKSLEMQSRMEFEQRRASGNVEMGWGLKYGELEKPIYKRLLEIAPDSIRAVLPYCFHEDGNGTTNLYSEVFANYGSECVEELEEILNENFSVEHKALIIRRLIRIDDVRSVDTLVKYLNGENETLRKEASDLYTRGKESFQILRNEKMSDALIKSLSDPNSMVKGNAAFSLGHTNNKNAIEPLIKLIQSEDKDAFCLQYAIESLGLFKDKRAISPITNILKGDYRSIEKSEAADVLSEFDDPEVRISLLDAFFNEEADSELSNVIRALTKLGAEASMRDKLIDCTVYDESKYSDKWLKLAAIPALAALGDDDSIKHLISIICERREATEVREEAYRSVNLLRDKLSPELKSEFDNALN